MMKYYVVLLTLLTAAGAGAAEPLRMNQIQVVGTHNSYHVAPTEARLQFLKSFTDEAEQWNFTHAPLDVQLDRGVRNLELDLYNGPETFEVFHVATLSEGTTCRLLKECLETVAAWSAAHPQHVPISLLLEIKDSEFILGGSRYKPIDRASLDRLDSLVNETLGERLLRPDQVRKNAATLEEAILTAGWPFLDEVRGRVMVVLHESGKNRDIYVEGRTSLEGRAMFVESEPGKPFAATLIMNNPADPEIPALAAKGYFIRTRADGGLRYSEERRAIALASGAHVVTTDFPPGEASASGYVVEMPGGAEARCNPITAPVDCAVETAAR